MNLKEMSNGELVSLHGDVGAELGRRLEERMRGHVDAIDAVQYVLGNTQWKKPKSPNQQRAELIQRAREFVEMYRPIVYDNATPLTVRTGDITIRFIVNKEKRTVVAIPRLRFIPKQVIKDSVGIAKCMPGDVFNEWIGKAIALARALEIEIPQEFLEAVQPDEKVVGMTVRNIKKRHDVNVGQTFQLAQPGRYQSTGKLCAIDSMVGRTGTIINDTNAEYGESK